MTVEPMVEVGNGKGRVLHLSDLVDRMLSEQPNPELEDPDVRYFWVDGSSFIQAFARANPIGFLLRYGKLARAYNKKVVVYDIDDVFDRNLQLSRGDEALRRIGIDLTREGIDYVKDHYR